MQRSDFVMEAAAAPALQALATQLAATDGVLHGVAAALVAAVGGELATTPLDPPERDLADAVSAKVAAGAEPPAPHGTQHEARKDAAYRRQLRAVQALRGVCRQWRDALDYSAITAVSLRGRYTMDWSSAAGTVYARQTTWRGLPRGCRFPALACLDLSRHEFTELPPGLRELPALRELRLGSSALVGLPPWLAELPLTKLHLGVATEANEAALTAAHPRSLRQWLCDEASLLPPTLEELTLDHTLPDDDEALLSNIPPCLAKLGRLQRLELGCAARDIAAVPEWFGGFPVLRHLDVFQTSIAPFGTLRPLRAQRPSRLC